MSVFKEELTLANAGDMSSARRGLILDTKIRQATIKAMPDTGAGTETGGLLAINGEIRQKRGLAIEETAEYSFNR
jgi:hypothetical protein